METKEATKHITQQWVRKEHFEAYQKCAKFRPDFCCKVIELERDEQELLIKARFVFTSIGRNMYMQRLIHFFTTSLTEYNETP